MREALLASVAAMLLASCGGETTASETAPSEPQGEAVQEAPAATVDGESIQTVQLAEDAIGLALLKPSRSDEARARDAGRKPGEILRLAKIEPGQTVVDIASSADYYAPILSSVVGPRGRLIMVGPKRLEEFFPQALQFATAYAEATENVDAVIVNLDEMSIDPPVDRVLNILYYHDTVWTGVDRAAMNKAVFDALKPGGYYLIVDHAAKTGSGEAVTQDLHRIDPATVMDEVLAAGFELAAESDALANPDDPMEEGVFGDLRGETNRFVYLFQKPE